MPFMEQPKPARRDRRAFPIAPSPGHSGTGYPATGSGARQVRFTGAPTIAVQIARRVCGEGGTGYTLGTATPDGPKLHCLEGSARVYQPRTPRARAAMRS